MSKNSFTNPIYCMGAVVDTALFKTAKREKGGTVILAKQTVLWQAFHNARNL